MRHSLLIGGTAFIFGLGFLAFLLTTGPSDGPASQSMKRAVLDSDKNSPHDRREVDSLEDVHEREYAQPNTSSSIDDPSIGKEESTPPPLSPPPELTFEEELEAKYGDMDFEQLANEWSTLAKSLGKEHNKMALQLIEEGKGVLVSQGEYSFPVSDDPDMYTGGYQTPHGEFYKVTVHRWDNPEFFLVRDEHTWVDQRMQEIAAREALEARQSVGR